MEYKILLEHDYAAIKIALEKAGRIMRNDPVYEKALTALKYVITKKDNGASACENTH